MLCANPFSEEKGRSQQVFCTSNWKNINHRRGKEHQFCLANAWFYFKLHNKYLNNMGYVGFEVFTAVVLKSITFWDMTPCSP
jgi:hypothetical protein